MVKRKIHWEFYLASAIITMVLVAGGIYFGVVLSREKITDLEKNLVDMKRSVDDISVEMALITSFENSSCSILSYEISRLANSAETLGGRVQLYDGTEKLKDPNFDTMKSDYTSTLIKYWMFLEKMKKSCNATNFVTNIYFYSNNGCEKCSEQGVILDYVKRIHPQNIMTFAIDSDLDSNLVGLLKNIYKVEKTPTLIINGQKYEGLVTLKDLNEILCTEAAMCD